MERFDRVVLIDISASHFAVAENSKQPPEISGVHWIHLKRGRVRLRRRSSADKDNGT